MGFAQIFKAQAAHAQPQVYSPESHFGTLLTPENARGLPVDRIEIEGLERTQAKVVHREVTIHQGESFEPFALQESLRRLKNMRIFYDVEARLIRSESGGVIVTFTLREKWTITPVFVLGGGGGTSFLALGLYDINILGSYLELGVRYFNYAGTHSGQIWFRDPRFLGERLSLGTEFSRIVRVRELLTFRGQKQGAFELDRTLFAAVLEKEISPLVALGVGVEIDADKFVTGHLTSSQREINAQSGFGKPRNAVTNKLRLITRLGGLNSENYLLEGVSAEGTVDLGSSLWGSAINMVRYTQNFLGFVRLRKDINLGSRLGFGIVNTSVLQHQFYLGGFDHLRGFLDGQFRGRTYWQGNVEARLPSLRTSVLILQHALFFDAGQAADTLSQLRPGDSTATSVGTGVRIVSPHIYRLTYRFDYAVTLTPVHTRGFSFGMQQFF